MQGRDAYGLVAAIDWTPVLVAVLTLAGVIFNGLVVLKIHARLTTPSGTSIGKQVEDAQHVALANHYRLAKLLNELGAVEEAD